MKCPKCNGIGYIIQKVYYSRSRKNFDTKEEAEKFKTEQSDHDKLDIIEEPATFRRCESYCNLKKFCPYFIKKEGKMSNLLFKEISGVVKNYNRQREMERDEKYLREDFDSELKQIIKKFLLKHFGKDYNNDLFAEFYFVITNLLERYQAKPQLF